MRVLELNIKEDMPPADVAVARLEIEIDALKGSDVGIIKVIHGYGSHGKGGEIKKVLLQRLQVLKKHKKIKDFIPGERLGFEKLFDLDLSENYPDLLVDSDIKNFNNGITLVVLK